MSNPYLRAIATHSQLSQNHYQVYVATKFCDTFFKLERNSVELVCSYCPLLVGGNTNDSEAVATKERRKLTG